SPLAPVGNLADTIGRQAAHSGIGRAGTAPERQPAHNKPCSPYARRAEGVQKPVMHGWRIRILLLELRLAQQIGIAPHLFRVDGETHPPTFECWSHVISPVERPELFPEAGCSCRST